MPANFENGVFGANKPAWHGAGVVLPDDVMDWETVKRHAPEIGMRVAGRPLFFPAADSVGLDDWAPTAEKDSSGIVTVTADDIVISSAQLAEGFVANVRADGRLVGIVGATYTPVQNDDAFGFLTDLCQSGEVIVHTAGTLDRGRRTWIQCYAPKAFKIAGETSEEHRGYVTFLNSFDGSTKVGCVTGAVRVVCSNTYNAAIDGAESSYWFKHTRNVLDSVNEARQALRIGQQYWQELERIGNAAIRMPFTDRQFGTVLDAVVPMPDKPGRKATNAERERETLNRLWRDSATIGNVDHTAWAAVNVFTEFVDHHIASRETTRNTMAQNRLNRILFETSIKDSAIARIFDMAGVS